MIAVIQRVSRASVTVDGETAGAIARGLLVLLGVRKGDGDAQADALARKIGGLRIFADDEGKMNRSCAEAGGAMLVVSQFTLCGDCRKGRRPSFEPAAPPAEATRLYERFCGRLREQGYRVETGVFGAMMDVELVNDGPVTFVLDTDDL
ncbi:MAG: D-tyrosyl-tRNA(Tyr) deacylase [Candidatus Brocadiae bacterium]|nr:D-tyrosyl-tRNA(Tyr) deacylase [Candidatus Brocadiia bacterium]